MSVNRIFGVLLLVSVFTSCFFEKTRETNISTKKICECYTQQEGSNIDERLKECLNPLNSFVNELVEAEYNLKEVEVLGAQGMGQILISLTQSCEAYRNSMVNGPRNFFTVETIEQADSIIGGNSKGVPLDTIKIAEAYFAKDDFQKATVLLDQYLQNNPHADLAYLMKSYCHYQINQIEESLSTLDIAMQNAKRKDFKEMLKLYRNTTSPIIPFEEEEITLTITKEVKPF